MFIDSNLKFGTLAERTRKQPGMPGTHKSLYVTYATLRHVNLMFSNKGE